MKKIILSVCVLMTVVALTTRVQAQIHFGPRAGVNVNSGGHAFVGAQAELSLPLLPITAVPNVEYYLQKETAVNFGADVQYTFIGVGVAKLVAGGGYTMQYFKSDVSGADATTESGFNVQFGAKASLFMNVFGLVRSTKIGSGSWTNALVVGVTF